MIHEFNIKTKNTIDFIDVTSQIQKLVEASRIMSGICYIFIPHTTAAVMLNEHADPSVIEDIGNCLNTLVPQHSRYRHIEGNSPAHIKAALIGSSQILFIEGGDLVLGTWQGVFFCEFDGPRTRRIIVKIIPDINS